MNDDVTYEHPHTTKTLKTSTKPLSSAVTQIPDRECCYNFRATTQVLVSYFGGKVDTKKGISINVN